MSLPKNKTQEKYQRAARAMVKQMACQGRCGDGTGKKPKIHSIDCPFWDTLLIK